MFQATNQMMFFWRLSAAGYRFLKQKTPSTTTLSAVILWMDKIWQHQLVSIGDHEPRLK